MSLAQFGRDECTIRVHLTPCERDLLAALLAHDPAKAVPLDRLIELVWPDADLEPDSAANRLQVAMTHLRAKGVQIMCDLRRGYYIAGRAASPMG